MRALAVVLVLAAASRASAEPVTLAAEQRGPVMLEIDADAVYWITRDAQVMRAPRHGGGAPIRLAAVPGQTGKLIALDASAVYFVTEDEGVLDTIWRVPLKGGAVKAIARKQQGVLGLAADRTGVYWGAGTAVRRAPRTGGRAVTLVADPGLFPMHLRLHRDRLYFANGANDDGDIKRMDRRRGATVEPALTTSWRQVATFDVSDEGIFACTEQGTLLRAPLAGPPTPEELGPASFVFAAGAYLWIVTGRELRARPFAGGPDEKIADLEGDTTWFVGDGNAVYAGRDPDASLDVDELRRSPARGSIVRLH